MMLGQQMIYIRDIPSLCEVTLASFVQRGCHHVPCLKKKPQDQEEEDGWCYLYLMAISWASHGHFMLPMARLARIHNSDTNPERHSAASKKTPQHEEAHSTNRVDLFKFPMSGS